MIREFLTPEFRKFLVTGGIAAAVNLGSRVLYDVMTDYSVAVLLAYLTGMVTAYLLAKRFVFVDAATSTSQSATRFVIVNLFGAAQTWFVSVGLAEWLFPAIGPVPFGHAIAHLAGVVAPVFSSFLGHRFWTFAAPNENPKDLDLALRPTVPDGVGSAESNAP